MYLLDTNVVSELRKARSGRADLQVSAWAAGVDASEMYLSAISVLELERGALRVERRDPAQGERLRQWLHRSLLPSFGTRVLVVDQLIAIRCARLHVPDPRSERDALIAATALVHGLTVVTRNTADFRDTGAQILNPWIPATP